MINEAIIKNAKLPLFFKYLFSVKIIRVTSANNASVDTTVLKDIYLMAMLKLTPEKISLNDIGSPVNAVVVEFI